MFHILSSDKIRKGKATDIYFSRAQKVLAETGADRTVTAEVRAASLPHDWQWGVLAGIEEVAYLFKGINIDVGALSEGTIFYPEEPVLSISGPYSKFAAYETALLGLLCQASGVATQSSRMKLAAQGKQVYSYGARRMHPTIGPMLDRSAFIGGCDGVSVVTSGEMLKEPAVGTMPHSLVMVIGDEKQAFAAFDQHMDDDIARIALVDTISDEKTGALTAAEILGERLYGVRLDTPRSRRGDMLKIVQEVRWELDIRGFEHVKIFVSGGLSESDIKELNRFASAYGVGTAISNAPTIDLSMDIVDIEGTPVAKRGKMSGAKDLLVCPNCMRRKVALANAEDPDCVCGGSYKGSLKPLIKKGTLGYKLPTPQKIREYVLIQLDSLDLETPL